MCFRRRFFRDVVCPIRTSSRECVYLFEKLCLFSVGLSLMLLVFWFNCMTFHNVLVVWIIFYILAELRGL